jgi:hypothetical protein
MKLAFIFPSKPVAKATVLLANLPNRQRQANARGAAPWHEHDEGAPTRSGISHQKKDAAPCGAALSKGFV